MLGTNAFGGNSRLKHWMHHGRAYLAGFGTGGSLVAGAALLFVLASALVAFDGWPALGSSTDPASVFVPASSHTAAPSPAVTQLVAQSTGSAAAGARAGRSSAAPVVGRRSTRRGPAGGALECVF